MNLRC